MNMLKCTNCGKSYNKEEYMKEFDTSIKSLYRNPLQSKITYDKDTDTINFNRKSMYDSDDKQKKYSMDENFKSGIVKTHILLLADKNQLCLDCAVAKINQEETKKEEQYIIDEVKDYMKDKMKIPLKEGIKNYLEVYEDGLGLKRDVTLEKKLDSILIALEMNDKKILDIPDFQIIYSLLWVCYKRMITNETLLTINSNIEDMSKYPDEIKNLLQWIDNNFKIPN